jgi:hypothetical protein
MRAKGHSFVPAAHNRVHSEASSCLLQLADKLGIALDAQTGPAMVALEGACVREIHRVVRREIHKKARAWNAVKQVDDGGVLAELRAPAAFCVIAPPFVRGQHLQKPLPCERFVACKLPCEMRAWGARC